MISLLVIHIALFAVENSITLDGEILAAIYIFDIGLAVLFLAEFLFELHFAKNKKQYFRHHWLYLLAAIPAPLMMFEQVRYIRALRLVKLISIFAHMRYEYNTYLFEKHGFRE